MIFEILGIFLMVGFVTCVLVGEFDLGVLQGTMFGATIVLLVPIAMALVYLGLTNLTRLW